MISVSSNALPAHLGHGDGMVGDAVPGMDGFVFGEECSLDAVPPPAEDPIAPGCYTSGAGWGDIQYVGPPDTAGNIVNYLSTGGSPDCSGAPFAVTNAVVTADDLAQAAAKCEAIGLTSLGERLNGDFLSYAGFPPNAWYCFS